MLYLLESRLPEKKSIYFALIYIYGIGKKRAVVICRMLGFSNNLKCENLSEDQINQIVMVVELLNLTLSNDLKKLKLLIIKRLVSIKSYRGLRRIKGLPIRGQRTHTNAKTSKRVN